MLAIYMPSHWSVFVLADRAEPLIGDINSIRIAVMESLGITSHSEIWKNVGQGRFSFLSLANW